MILSGFCRVATLLSALALLGLAAPGDARAQSQSPPQPRSQTPAQPRNQAAPPPPPQGTSRGENFSAKHPAALFASDCTGAGCHRGPQGLAKDKSVSGLASFLREHYTNSRESAASLAAYLTGAPASMRAPPPEPAARQQQPPRTATRPEEPPKPQAGDDAARQRRTTPETPPPPQRGAQRSRQTTAATPPEPPPPSPPQFDIFD